MDSYGYIDLPTSDDLYELQPIHDHGELESVCNMIWTKKKKKVKQTHVWRSVLFRRKLKRQLAPSSQCFVVQVQYPPVNLCHYSIHYHLICILQRNQPLVCSFDIKKRCHTVQQQNKIPICVKTHHCWM